MNDARENVSFEAGAFASVRIAQFVHEKTDLLVHIGSALPWAVALTPISASTAPSPPDAPEQIAVRACYPLNMHSGVACMQ
jgi:hypothetical protein